MVYIVCRTVEEYVRKKHKQISSNLAKLIRGNEVRPLSYENNNIIQF